jgi:hypothetical protein
MIMVLTDEVRRVIEKTAFLSLVTMGEDGLPHPIIAGKGEISGDTIVFGIYKMERTQKNLARDGRAWVTGATLDGEPRGCRLCGSAAAEDRRLVFTPERAEKLI